MYRVGFWFRVLALLIDLAIFLPLALVPCLLVGASEWLADLILLWCWLLFSTFEIFGVGTPGKRLFRLQIANADGSPADFWTRSLRWSTKQMPVYFGAVYVMTQDPSMYLLTGVAKGFVGIGCLYASTEFRQAWHDQWAQTAVIRPPKAPENKMGAVLQTLPPPLPVAAAMKQGGPK